MGDAFKSWPPYGVVSLRRTFNTLVEVVEDPEKELTPESRAWLARFLVVRSAEFLEQAIAECLRGYVREKSAGMVRVYATSWLEKSRNPSVANLLEVVGRFDQAVQVEFQSMLDEDDERLGRSLHYLVATRNSIAHGLNEGVNPAKALDLAKVSEELADWFILRFNPLR